MGLTGCDNPLQCARRPQTSLCHIERGVPVIAPASPDPINGCYFNESLRDAYHACIHGRSRKAGQILQESGHRLTLGGLTKFAAKTFIRELIS